MLNSPGVTCSAGAVFAALGFFRTILAKATPFFVGVCGDEARSRIILTGSHNAINFNSITTGRKDWFTVLDGGKLATFNEGAISFGVVQKGDTQTFFLVGI